MTDIEFVHSVLNQGPATSAEILAKSFAERRCGLTVHSRVADLRKQLIQHGLEIDCRRVGSRNGRGLYRYEIVPSRLFAA